MPTSESFSLGPRFDGWFSQRGWTPRPHQLALTERSLSGQSTLLIAPTGGGKTLAGFMASLIDLDRSGPRSRPALHTLYISPLKALAVDVQRNLMQPVEETGLAISIETRTGDTPQHKRQRQRKTPPDILLTTPEQLALFIASDHADDFFADLKYVIIDEVHALAPNKRGDLLCLGLATLAQWAPDCCFVGLSATVQSPNELARWLSPAAGILETRETVSADIAIMDSRERIPWSGHSGRFAAQEIYEAISEATLALVFVNTRSQAELMFQELWHLNEDNLAIGLHHGSLAKEQRRKVERAMAEGVMRAVVCTSTLDLGIDWGAVDLVIQLGAPKGAARLVQRIGRANHRMDEASRALLVPTNRFEVLECRAAMAALQAGELDGQSVRSGTLDVLAQHVMGRACGTGFELDALYQEVRSAAPYQALDWPMWEALVDFVATGGYSLRTYDRFKRIVRRSDGLWVARTARDKQLHRMNVGTIIDAGHLNVRLGHAGKGQRGGRKPMQAGRKLGEIEEYFIEGLTPGDTFLFAGQILRLLGVEGEDALVVRTSDTKPAIPAYNGGKFPLSTFLAERVRQMVHTPEAWADLPEQVSEWLTLQMERSTVPSPHELLIETFPRRDRHYLVCYPFEGRLAHQTLGMLLTRRLERAGAKPLGFVASEYALAVWGMKNMASLDMSALFHEDMLGDDLDAWLEESALMKRTFKACAQVSGLIARRLPGNEKTSRQVTFSTDLIYNVLRTHQPDHLLLQATRADAATGLLDIRRLGDMLGRTSGKLVHKALPKISPFAVPVMLEVGREPVLGGSAAEAILRDAEVSLIEEAMG
jgi:ATP-dependent Lhr-like helicase